MKEVTEQQLGLAVVINKVACVNTIVIRFKEEVFVVEVVQEVV